MEIATRQPKRGRGEGTVGRRKDGAYFAAVSRNRHRIWAYGKSAEEAQAKLAIKLAAPQPPPREAGESVYAVQRADGLVKIGYSRDVALRLRDLVEDFGKLRILAVLVGGRRLERQLHDRFAGYRVVGEWFRPGSELLTALSSEAVG